MVPEVGTIRSVYPERHMLTSIKASEGEKSRADKIALKLKYPMYDWLKLLFSRYCRVHTFNPIAPSRLICEVAFKFPLLSIVPMRAARSTFRAVYEIPLGAPLVRRDTNHD